MDYDFFTLLVTIFIGSGGIVSIFVFVFDYLAKKRASELAMSKFRINEINKKYADYMLLVSHSGRLSDYFKCFQSMSDYDKVKTFMSVLKVIQTITKINRGGSFLLSDQSAESVLYVLTSNISRDFGTIFKEFDYTEFRDLNSDISFHTVKSKINTVNSEYKKYYDMLWTWLLITDIPITDSRHKETQTKRNQIIEDIQIRSNCISELLSYEINMVYSDWYRGGFNNQTYLSENVTQYLKNKKIFTVNNKPAFLSMEFPKYYSRIFQS